MTGPRMMRQVAPFPEELEYLVSRWRYRPGWTFSLADVDRGQGSEGLTLDIVTYGYDSHHPERGECYRVHHYMPVPPAAYNRQSWQRWLFDQCLLVDRHEACEFAAVLIGEGPAGAPEYVLEHPYAPNHGPGWDPYIVTELTTETDRRTSFRGDLNPNLEADTAAVTERVASGWRWPVADEQGLRVWSRDGSADCDTLTVGERIVVERAEAGELRL